MPYLPDLARLRIDVFRDFPYLYEGDAGYEERYLRTYSEAPESLFVAVFDEDRVVGASTGVPMEYAEKAFKAPFVEHDYDPKEIFYFGESVLLPDYRGRGLGGRFFDEREAYARELGRFRYTTFCAVQRPADHPQRPPAYRPLDAFWKKRGYRKHPELRTMYTWRDVGAPAASAKPMVFWLKPMAA